LNLERATQTNEVENEYLQAAPAKIDRASADHLAKNVLALAQAKGHNSKRQRSSDTNRQR